MGGLEVGGKERVVLQLVRRARSLGLDHRIVLFDTPFRNSELDFDPGELPVEFIARAPGFDRGFARRLGRYWREHDVELVHRAQRHGDLLWSSQSGLVRGSLAPPTGPRRDLSCAAHPSDTEGEDADTVGDAARSRHDRRVG